MLRTMETNFVKKQDNYKEKPLQFYSVAAGVQNRLENSLKKRKQKRMTIFDSIRNIVYNCDNLLPTAVLTWGQLKIKNRRQQLAIWKNEKENKKKEKLAQKKKPFLTGIAHLPLQFVPPPSIPKSGASSRDTRSKTKPNLANRTSQSTAPKHTQYRAPEQATVNKLVLAPPLRATKGKAITKNAKQEAHPTNSRINSKEIFEAQSSSSGSYVAPSDIIKNIKTPGLTKLTKEKKIITPKILHLESTTSELKSSSEEKSNIVRNSTDDNSDSGCTSSVITVRNLSFSPINPSETSKDSFDSSSSDVEFISENALTPNNKKIAKSESSAEQKARSSKSPREWPLTLEQMEIAKKTSSYVTLSRGKDKVRRNMKEKIGEAHLDHDSLEEDSLEQFRSQLASVTLQMKAQCLAWAKTLEQAGHRMPDAAQGLIRAAVGQTHLLMSQKLEQFAKLVERCANPASGATLVTPADLWGFWDMVSIQVVKVAESFKKLEELRAHNWVEKKPVEVKKKAVPKAGNKKPVKSRLRDMIAAARKARKAQEFQPRSEVVPPSEPQKTFKAGFFCVITPVKPPATSGNTSHLLNASQTTKCTSRRSASFAMLRASMHSKDVQFDGVAPLQVTPMKCS